MSFKFLNEGQSGNIQEFTPIDTFIDPVSKIRVSNPSNLIDTDFEYGLQPTKWETVELINNTPAFFSKGGDTTIPDITGITTNAGTREITVTTAFPHNLAVGIPIRVAGTKSVTADGSYIINATPTLTTFTYLSRANQTETLSVFDLYSSIITGEFFQGSQISISDAEGITTDGQGPISTLTVKTENKHGFGPNTPFYFLNLNSTISQEFEAQNTASVSFDPTNSATAQSFDGSNTLLQTPIDLSNSATTATQQDNITSTSPTNSTFTISINAANELAWSNISVGDPLYYSVVAGGGFFQANPRGVVFIKDVAGVNAEGNVATFQVSELPDGNALPVLANTQGFFQAADQARTFAGNNVNEETQVDLTIELGPEFLFDGGNQGYDGDPESPPSNVGTVVGYTGTSMTLFTSEGFLDYYVGAMLRYSTDGAVATGLSNNSTYFVTAFAPGQSAGLFTVSISELPGEDASDISISGGSGSQTFSKIGVSVDKDIIHVRNSNFEQKDMLLYTYPTDPVAGNFGADEEKKFYFVQDAYDEHNYKLSDAIFTPTVATGGNNILDTFVEGRLYRVHTFSSTGNSTFSVQSLGTEPLAEYLVVAGGGGAGNDDAGGGGGGGMLEGTVQLSEQSYTVTVGTGGNRGTPGTNQSGFQGGNSSVFGVTALGGGGGAFQEANGGNGGSGGGGGHFPSAGGLGTAGQGFNGGRGETFAGGDWAAGGGGGAGQQGANGIQGNNATGKGGDGRQSNITGTATYYGGGGGGQSRRLRVSGGLGGGGQAGTESVGAENGVNGLGGGAGGGGNSNNERLGGLGGSGVVIIRYPLTAADSDAVTVATGGDVSSTQDGAILYAVHDFTQVGTSTFNVESLGQITGANQAQYMILAGGGGGSSDDAGGGGGGGMLEGTAEIAPGSYTVVVGAGGARTPAGSSANGSNGGNSSVFGITAIGGGGGGFQGVNGNNGGSGGGGGHFPSAGGLGTAGQGFNGGRGHTAAGGSWSAGGGGGAGGPGNNGQEGSSTSSLGGIGRISNITGSATYYGGGGGGQYRGRQSAGGLGGGGAGGGDPFAGSDGVNGLGGGGGGGGNDTNSLLGGNGGSGRVIIRYPIATFQQ